LEKKEEGSETISKRRKQGNKRKSPKRNIKNKPKTKPEKLNSGVFQRALKV